MPSVLLNSSAEMFGMPGATGAKAGLEHELALGAAAMTSGDVPVARQADVGVHGTAHGDGVAAVLDGQLILHAAVAVTGGRVDARGVDLRGALDRFGRARP